MTKTTENAGGVVDPDAYSPILRTLLWWNAKVVKAGYSTVLPEESTPLLRQHLHSRGLGQQLVRSVSLPPPAPLLSAYFTL
jgi:hypothetical protein